MASPQLADAAQGDAQVVGRVILLTGCGVWGVTSAVGFVQWWASARRADTRGARRSGGVAQGRARVCRVVRDHRGVWDSLPLENLVVSVSGRPWATKVRLPCGT